MPTRADASPPVYRSSGTLLVVTKSNAFTVPVMKCSGIPDLRSTRRGRSRRMASAVRWGSCSVPEHRNIRWWSRRPSVACSGIPEYSQSVADPQSTAGEFYLGGAKSSRGKAAHSSEVASNGVRQGFGRVEQRATTQRRFRCVSNPGTHGGGSCRPRQCFGVPEEIAAHGRYASSAPEYRTSGGPPCVSASSHSHLGEREYSGTPDLRSTAGVQRSSGGPVFRTTHRREAALVILSLVRSSGVPEYSTASHRRFF